jgi:hypothetical protein
MGLRVSPSDSSSRYRHDGERAIAGAAEWDSLSHAQVNVALR